VEAVRPNVLLTPRKTLELQIALSYYDVTINKFIKILSFNARDHGRLAGEQNKANSLKIALSLNSLNHEEKWNNFQMC